MKRNLKHNIVYDKDNQPISVTVFARDGLRHKMFVAGPSHPNFVLVVDALEQGRPAHEVLDLFDVESALTRGFDLARKLIKGVANETISRVWSSRPLPQPSPRWPNSGDRRYEWMTDEELAEVKASDNPNEVEARILADRVISDAAEATNPTPPPVVKTNTPDELDSLNQRELQALAKQVGAGSGVGVTNEALRERIRQRRSLNLATVVDSIEVKDGHLYWGGEEVHGALADAVIAYHRQGHRDFTPLVRFMAKLLENPNPHSREHLYEWMQHLSFAIHEDGDIIAYKGVRRSNDGLVSDRSDGTATVNGKLYKRQPIPNPIGGTVSMPRGEVTFNPAVGCSKGLHIGTVQFATGFGNALIEVKVNPADVVSVPTEDLWQKLRVCRYTILRECTADEARQLRKDTLARA